MYATRCVAMYPVLWGRPEQLHQALVKHTRVPEDAFLANNELAFKEGGERVALHKTSRA